MKSLLSAIFLLALAAAAPAAAAPPTAPLGGADVLCLSGVPQTTVPGAPLRVSITAYPQNGFSSCATPGVSVDAANSVPLAFSGSDGAMVVPTASLTAGVFNGVVKLATAGNQTLTVNDVNQDVAATATVAVVSAAVGGSAQTFTVTIANLATALNPSAATAVQVVTQGSANADFTDAGGGSCDTAAGAIPATGTCTIIVNFQPKTPGPHTGAVELYDGASPPNLLATVYVAGVGQGAQLSLFGSNNAATLANSTTSSGFSGVAADAHGNVFYTDQNAPGGANVFEIPYAAASLAGGGAGYGAPLALAPGTSIPTPVALSLDGAGNLYVATGNAAAVYKIAYANGAYAATAAAVNTPGFTLGFVSDVYADSLGNLFIADYGIGRIVEVTPAGAAFQVYGGDPYSISGDAQGNLFVGDPVAGGGLDPQVYEIPAGSWSATAPATSTTDVFDNFAISDPSFLPGSVRTDGRGNVIVVDQFTATLWEFSLAPPQDEVDVWQFPSQGIAAAFDGADNIYITGDTATPAAASLQKLDAEDPGVNFGSQPEFELVQGYTGLSNTGTLQATLAPVAITGANAQDFTLTANSCPLGSGTLAAGSECLLQFGFSPSQAGSESATLTITSNGYNSPQSGLLTGSGNGTTLLTGLTAAAPAQVQAGASFGVDVSPTCVGTNANGCNFGTLLNFGGTVHFSSSDPNAILPPDYAFVTPDFGLHSFPVTLFGLGPQTVTVTVGGAFPAVASTTVVAAPAGAVVGGFAQILPVVFTPGNGTVVNHVAVLTQGLTGQDFQLAPGGDQCSSTLPHGGVQSCTVAVAFTPLAAGLRRGAVELLGASGNILETGYVSAIGQAPQVAFRPGIQSVAASGFSFPVGISFDVNGNAYIADMNAGKIYVNTTATVLNTAPITLIHPEATAFDGAGNLFIVDNSSSFLIEKTAAGITRTVGTGGLQSPLSLAIDGGGNIFVGESSGMVELAAGTFAQSTVPITGTGISCQTQGVLPPCFSVGDLAVDGQGSLYLADPGQNTVLKVPETGGAVLRVGGLSGGLVAPEGVAVDAAGDLFVTDASNHRVDEIPAGSVSAVGFPLQANEFPGAMAIQPGTGNLFFVNPQFGQLLEINLQDPYPAQAPFDFADTPKGASSINQSFTLLNTGNLPLTLDASSGVQFPPDFPNQASTCANGAAVPPGEACTIVVNFTPQSINNGIVGEISLTDNAGNLGGTHQSLNLVGNGVAGPASQLVFTQSPTNTAAGAIMAPAVTVAVEDAEGNVVTGASGTVTLALNGNGVLAGGAATALVNGVATFNGLLVSQPGVGDTLTAATSVAGLSNATSNAFAVYGAVTRLAFIQQPSNVAAGAAMTPAVTVAAEDALGTAAAAVVGTVTLALNGNGTLSGGGTVALVNGIATFPGLSVNLVGTGDTLTASTSRVGVPNLTSNTFTVVPGPAVTLAFTQQPASEPPATVMTPPVTVAVEDAEGNVVTTAAGTVTLTLNGTGVLTGGSAAALVNGVSTFASLSVSQSGAGDTLTATTSVPGLIGIASATFTINPAVPTQLVFTQQPSDTPVYQPIAPAVTVAVEDAQGNVVTGATGTVTLSSSLGGTHLTGGGAAALVNGVATFAGLSVDEAILNVTLTAATTVAGVPNQTSTPFDSGLNVPVKLVFNQQPANVAAGAAVAPAVTVALVDNLGHPGVLSANPVTLTLNGNGTLLGGGPVAMVGGVATFAGLSINQVGAADTLTASTAGFASVTSTPFAVTPGAPTQLVFVQQPADIPVFQPLTPAVTVAIEDAQGNVVTGATGTVTLTPTGIADLSPSATVTLVNGVATFTGFAVSQSFVNLTLTASTTVAGVPNLLSATFNVTPNIPVKLVFNQQPANVAAGAAMAPAVTVALVDNLGHPGVLSANPVTLTLNGNGTLLGGGPVAMVAGVATFPGLSLTQVGTADTLTASTAGFASVTSAPFAVSSGAAARFAVNAPATATAGIAASFSVAALDAFGNAATGYDGNVRFTSSDAAARLPGNSTLSAGAGTFANGVVFGTAGLQTITATDTANPALAGTSAPTTVTAPVETTLQLSAVGLIFASQAVGGASLGQTLVLSNPGTAAASISGITISGADPGDFTLTSGCGVLLAGGASCPLSLVFAPTAIGSRTALISVTDLAANSPQTANLSGLGVVPGVNLAPAALNFGSQTVNTVSPALAATVSNTGGALLTISNVAVSAGFSLTGSCPTVLPGASCSLGVQFAPTATGAVSGALTFTDDAGGGTQVLPLSGTGIAPGVQLSPASLTLPPVAVGAASFGLQAELTNTGDATLTGISIPAQSGDFTVSNVGATACGGTLAPGASCGFLVSLTPTVAGQDSATLVISDSLGTQSLALAGTGIAPGLTLSSLQASFGSQTVGTASNAQTLTLANGSAAAINITAVNVLPAGTFGENDNCLGPLPPSESCNLNITFAPTATGPAAGTLSIQYSAANTPLTVALAGLGVNSLLLSPANLGFGAVEVGNTGPQQTINVTNTGTTTLTLAAPKTAGDFAVAQNLCQAPLAPGSSCQLFVNYAPASTGLSSGSVTIGDSSGTLNASATLTGQGTTAGIAVVPAAVAFGSVSVNTPSATQTVTIRNTGSAPLTLDALSVVGDFAVAGTNCLAVGGGPLPLAAGANCVVSLRMTATTPGSRTGTLQIYNDVNGLVTAALEGTGTGAGVSLFPALLAFGSQPIPGAGGQIVLAGAAQTVTLTNSGNAALGIAGIATQGGFTQSNTCGASLPAQASCTIEVGFAPTALGPWTGALNISDSANGDSVQTVALSGLGSPNGLTMSPPTLDFGGAAVGVTSAPLNATLTNGAGSPVSDLSIVASGEFGVTSTCGATLAVGAACTLSVTVTPVTPGGITGAISISGAVTAGAQSLVDRRGRSGGNAQAALAGSSSIAAIALQAAGGSAQLSLSSSSLDFASIAVGSSSPGQDITIANSGAGPLDGLTLSSSPDFPVTTTCAATLAPAAACMATVVFTPTGVGQRTGQLTVAAGSAQNVVALNGTATGGNLTLVPSTLVFGARAEGTASTAQLVSIENTGTVPVTLQSAAVAGADFSLGAGSCGALPDTLAAGAGCSMAVTFTPSTTGAEAATLTINSNAANPAATAALSGSGNQVGLSLSSVSLNLGNVGVGFAGTAQTLTLTNAGAVPIAIAAITAAGDFSQSNNCGVALAAAAACSVQVIFAPSVAGARAGSITVNDAAAVQSVALAGTGTEFTMVPAAASGEQTIAPGGLAVFQINFTPGDFTGPVQLSCSGAPSFATCQVNPGALSLIANGSVQTATVTVNTAGAAAAPTLPPFPPHWPWLAAGAMLLFALGAGYCRRHRLLLGAGLGLALLAGGCARMAPATPAGIYALTITAASGAATQTTTLTLAIN